MSEVPIKSEFPQHQLVTKPSLSEWGSTGRNLTQAKIWLSMFEKIFNIDFIVNEKVNYKNLEHWHHDRYISQFSEIS